MEVKYADNALKRLCTDEKEMRRKRADIERKLRLRVNALNNARDVGHLQALDPLGRWHDLNGDMTGLWAGSVSPNHRIMFRPEGTGPDVTAVTVTVVGIDDYHKR